MVFFKHKNIYMCVLTCAPCNNIIILNRQAAREIGNTELTQGLLHNNTNGPRSIQPNVRPGSSMDHGDHDQGSNGVNKGAKGTSKGNAVKGSGAKGPRSDDESGNKRRKNLTLQFCNFVMFFT